MSVYASGESSVRLQVSSNSSWDSGAQSSPLLVPIRLRFCQPYLLLFAPALNRSPPALGYPDAKFDDVFETSGVFPALSRVTVPLQRISFLFPLKPVPSLPPLLSHRILDQPRRLLHRRPPVPRPHVEMRSPVPSPAFTSSPSVKLRQLARTA